MIKNSIHPGDFLRVELETRKISQSALAQHINVTPGVINQLCNGKRGISAVMAKKLGCAFGTTPELWMKLQVSYDLARAKDPSFGKIQT